MLFSDVRVKDIDWIVHFAPQSPQFTSRNRKNHIIGIKLSGAAEHLFSDRSFTLQENSIYFFNQSENYSVNILRESLAFSIHFTTFDPIDLPSFFLQINDRSQILRIMERIERQFRLHGHCTAGCLSDLYQLFAYFEEVHDKKYLPKGRIHRAKEYINLHFEEKTCLQKAAELCGVTQRRFQDLFRESFHSTPNQYIISCKINLARKLLLAQELSVSQIAELCGFSDIYYFSKLFKKETGQTPSQFRKTQEKPD